jgi:hypothetical protein
VLPKGFSKSPGDAAPCLAPGGASREPRSEQESLPTISNLGSWNGLLAHLPAGFISATASSVRAEELRRTYFDLNGRPALSLRACAAPSKTVLCRLRSGAPSNPSIFQRYPCSHYGRPRVVQPFRGITLQRLMRSAPGTASSISPKQLLCKLFLVCNLAHLFTPQSYVSYLPPENLIHQKAVGPPPLPGRWPSDPYRPVTGLRKCPLRSCPAGRASVIEVSNHRWTFDPLLREAAKFEHFG